MKTTKSKPYDGYCLKNLSWILVGSLLLGLTGCSTTRQLRTENQSGFLGDYSMLRPGGKNEANYIYIDEKVNWAKYTKVFVEPVELWHSDDPDSPLGKLSKENQELLVSYAYHSLVQYLGMDCQLVDKPGPDVLVVRSAITDAEKSKPALNLATSAYPPLRLISMGKRLATGSDIAVGKVYGEVEFLDGETGKRVAAGVDARVGTKALRSKFGGTWGDVKLAFDWWAQRIAVRLAQVKAGNFSPPDKS